MSRAYANRLSYLNSRIALILTRPTAVLLDPRCATDPYTGRQIDDAVEDTLQAARMDPGVQRELTSIPELCARLPRFYGRGEPLNRQQLEALRADIARIVSVFENQQAHH